MTGDSGRSHLFERMAQGHQVGGAPQLGGMHRQPESSLAIRFNAAHTIILNPGNRELKSARRRPNAGVYGGYIFYVRILRLKNNLKFFYFFYYKTAFESLENTREPQDFRELQQQPATPHEHVMTGSSNSSSRGRTPLRIPIRDAERIVRRRAERPADREARLKKAAELTKALGITRLSG